MFLRSFLSGLVFLAAFLPSPLPALSALVLPGDVPKLSSAADQLAHAKQAKAEARGTKGAARVAALERAAGAYAAVAEYWPDAGAVTAEAAFRRGEILRTLGKPGAARGAFQEAFDSGAGTVFAPRALLESGHLHRRAGEFDLALKDYGRVHTLEGVDLRYRNDAREWTGKVHLTLQDWKPAAAAFLEWAQNAEGPIEVVRAVDLEARAWIGAGDLAHAASRVKQLQVEMEALVGEPTKEAEALRAALERMKAPGLLDKARAQAAGNAAPAAG